MKYRVVFECNCALVKTVDADSKEEAERIVRQKLENNEFNFGDLELFEYYYNMCMEV